MTRKLICISCPIGCELTVTQKDDQVLSVTGNTCSRGLVYAQDECIDPKRMLTTTLSVQGSAVPLAVRTSVPIRKDAVQHAVRELKKMQIKPPIRTGELLFSNFLDLGADILATQSTSDC